MADQEWEEKLAAARDDASSPRFAGVIHRYSHVERLGHDDVDGLLVGEVVVQEKIDGANLTVGKHPVTGELIIASRNNVVSLGGKPPEGFRGAIEYIYAHHGIRRFLSSFPEVVLRAEWLVRHSMVYAPEFMNRLWVYDAQNYSTQPPIFISPKAWMPWMVTFGIDFIPILAELENPSIDQLVELLKQPSIFGAEFMEGIVAKRYDPPFVNKWGRTQWGKLVAEDFKTKNKMEFGPRHGDPVELILVHEYVTVGMIVKEIERIKDERGEVSVRDMAQIMGRLWYTVFQECLWDFVKKHKVTKFDFRAARHLAEGRIRDIALSYFNGTLEGVTPKSGTP